ncbi:MAG: Mfa1 family fimbria major subunit [Porphyromonas sp.]|nr:Mfa1 family fimbria major subunit [Porphyromonas sp.]
MMSTYHTILRGLSGLFVATLLTACQGTVGEPSDTEAEMSHTATRFAVRMETQALRAGVTQGDNDGTKGEQQVNQMTVLLSNQGAHFFGSGELEREAQTVSSPIFKVPTNRAGSVRVALILNGSDIPLVMPGYTGSETVALTDFDKLVDATDGVGRYKNFLMTTTAAQADNNITIQPGISKEEVRDKSANVFGPLNVERLLSKAVVYRAASPSLSGAVSASRGTLDVNGLTYALAGSAKEAYIFRDYAGASNKMDSVTAEYDGKTVVDTLCVPAEWKGSEPHPFLQRVSDYLPTDGTNAAKNFAAKPVIVPTETATPLPIYFLENSTNQTVTGRGQLEYNRITYAKVYGAFKPKQGLHYDIEQGRIWRNVEADEFNKERKYSFDLVTTMIWPELSFDLERDQQFFKQLQAKYGGEEVPEDPSDIWIEWNRPPQTYMRLFVKDPPGTFYYGRKTNKIYYDLLTAIKDENFYEVDRYVGGKMVWLFPVNARREGTGPDSYVKNADTRRNNIYDIEVKGISGLGHPFDPMDPSDPNIPEPENPFAPPADDHMPVDPLVKTIDIRARVMKWNYIFRSYDLKEPTETITPQP